MLMGDMGQPLHLPVQAARTRRTDASPLFSMRPHITFSVNQSVVAVVNNVAKATRGAPTIRIREHW